MITLLIPLFGWLSDRIGRKRIAFMTLIAIVVGFWPVFLLFEQPTMLTVLGAQLAFAVIVAAQQGINPAFLAEQFQHPQSRLTAFSLSFSLAYALSLAAPLRPWRHCSCISPATTSRLRST